MERVAWGVVMVSLCGSIAVYTVAPPVMQALPRVMTAGLILIGSAVAAAAAVRLAQGHPLDGAAFGALFVAVVVLAVTERRSHARAHALGDGHPGPPSDSSVAG